MEIEDSIKHLYEDDKSLVKSPNRLFFSDKFDKNVNKFLEKKVKDVVIFVPALFSLYTAIFVAPIIKDNKNYKQKIELVKTIYNTQGGNEALRYPFYINK